jgi:RNase adapter protein RapZ
MVAFLLPLYEQEGKSYLTVGIGCTGGRHRSVAVAEHLGKLLTERGWPVQITHREIERRGDVNPLEAAS